MDTFEPNTIRTVTRTQLPCPAEILCKIFGQLNSADLYAVAQVDKAYRQAAVTIVHDRLAINLQKFVGRGKDIFCLANEMLTIIRRNEKTTRNHERHRRCNYWMVSIGRT